MSEEKAIEILDRARNAGRLHHAILLYGKALEPLEYVAREMASRLFGRSYVKNPDLFELRPSGKMRQIKIGKTDGEPERNTMRELLKNIRETSVFGDQKVAIVYEADRMNFVTANAFLKTLEEPPPRTTIFMLSTRPGDILDTIRSRCISLRVDTAQAKLDSPEWEAWLEDYKAWQKDVMAGIGKAVKLSEAMMRCYGLLARFEAIEAQILEENAGDIDESEELDEDMLVSLREGHRRAICKRMLSDLEKACVWCALGGNGVPAVKTSRVVAALEKASGLMELNMNDSFALEYFMISSLRIWTR